MGIHKVSGQKCGNSETDENPFAEIAETAMKILCSPLSNAEVERQFSQMNLIKTKSHNTVVALMQIRAYLKLHDVACFKFEPSEKMFCRFNQEIYSNDESVCDSSEVYTTVEDDTEIEVLNL